MSGPEKKLQGNQPKIKILDFDSLVEIVKKMSFDEGQYMLWEEVYKLPRWYFTAKPVEDISQLKPFICEVDGKGWFCASTDAKHAIKFAERQKFNYPGGKTLVICMKPLEAAEWMSTYSKEVYGVRFNEGEHGWYAPIANLLPMYQYLKGLNKIYC